ncbi:MAG TPA: FecR family protein [Xanthobacteraceae bacterium]|nr:FecR family protein [Xanthobacteraceae bacterium]
MLRRIDFPGLLIPLAVAAALCAASSARAQEATDAKALWQVGKSSGEVWLTTSGVQPASLTEQATLKPGDSIRTGRNGRVLLVRGEESILVAPNSAITVPPPKNAQTDGTADGQSTTILQQAGSILLQVEKRNVRNFEVETPYLVAAVKGTEFRVTLDRVDVLKGSVEVADVKSGQYALVFPGQSAKVALRGGLSLSGAGLLAPVQKGAPRATTLRPLSVPRGGLAAPGGTPDGQHVRALGAWVHAAAADGGAHAGDALRIGAALGEVKLDIHKVTNGLAHDGAAAKGQLAKSTVWSSGDITPGNGVGKSYNAGNNGSGSGTGSVSGASGGNGNAGGSASAGGNGNGAAGAVNGAVNGVVGSVNGVVGSVESALGGNGNGNGNAFGLNGGNGVGKALGLLKHPK